MVENLQKDTALTGLRNSGNVRSHKQDGAPQKIEGVKVIICFASSLWRNVYTVKCAAYSFNVLETSISINIASLLLDL